MSIITGIFAFLFIIFGLPIYLLYKFFSNISNESDKEKFKNSPPPVKNSTVVSPDVSSASYSITHTLDLSCQSPSSLPQHTPLYNITVYHNTPPSDWQLDKREQRLRFLRAIPLSPLKIDYDKKIAKYLSSRSSQIYLTTLAGCSCPDSQKHHICKHTYSLAINCGLLSPAVDLWGIPSEMIDEIKNIQRPTENYNDPYKTLSDILKMYRPKLDKKFPTIYTTGEPKILFHLPTDAFRPNRLKPLLDSGILSPVSLNEFDFCDFVCESYTLEQFKSSAKYACPVIRFPSLPKRELIEYICSNHTDIEKAVNKPFTHVCIDTKYILHRSNVISYLEDTYINPIQNFVDYQSQHQVLS